jgi:hypothetical protein
MKSPIPVPRAAGAAVPARRPIAWRRSLCLTVLATLASLTVGCSAPGFNSAYRKSVDAYQSAEVKPKVTGPWEGYWKSDVNGHTGKLRAIAQPGTPAVPVDGASGRYIFRYHATWAKVLSGGYTSPHDVVRQRDGSFRVSGEKDIAFIATYLSDGTIRGEAFDSTYRSSGDRGVFVLRRPE